MKKLAPHTETPPETNPGILVNSVPPIHVSWSEKKGFVDQEIYITKYVKY